MGVAGYTMGGRFSNLSPKMGLAVDNVLEFEVSVIEAVERWDLADDFCTARSPEQHCRQHHV